LSGLSRCARGPSLREDPPVPRSLAAARASAAQGASPNVELRSVYLRRRPNGADTKSRV
jgi:hypothetical protein